MTDYVKILLHDEVQLLDWGESRSAGVWIKFRLLDASLLEPFRGLDTAGLTKTGHILNLTVAEGDVIGLAAAAEQLPVKTTYGEYAKKLRLSGYFLNLPQVWKAVGTDSRYRQWIMTMPSFINKFTDHHPDTNDIKNDAHHVLRATDKPARIGTNKNKPAYKCVPLTHEQHVFCHDHGEKALLTKLIYKGREDWTTDQAKIVFNQKVEEYVEDWCWMTLKEILGHESWSELEPTVLCEWAKKKGVYKELPPVYKNYKPDD